MSYFKFLIEGLFVDADREEGGRLGFHSTFLAQGEGAQFIRSRLSVLLNERMQLHRVRAKEYGFPSTVFFIRDYWEVSSAKFSEESGRDLGFTFFRIGPVEQLLFWLEARLLKVRKSWLFIDAAATSIRSEND